METTRPPVNLYEFAESVDCHFTTASRLRAGTRIPGRELFMRIVKTYDLDYNEALTAFCGPRDEFGSYLRTHVFGVTDEEWQAELDRVSDKRARRQAK